MQCDGLQPGAMVTPTSVVQLVQGGQQGAEEDGGEPDVAAVEYDTYHNHDQGMAAPDHQEQQEDSGEAGSPLSSLTVLQEQTGVDVPLGTHVVPQQQPVAANCCGTPSVLSHARYFTTSQPTKLLQAHWWQHTAARLNMTEHHHQ